MAYYRGDGVDLSGYGYDAIPHGNVNLVADRFGQPGKAASFDGDVGTYLEIVNHPLLPLGAAPRTVSVWTRSTTNFSNFAGIWNYGTALAPYGRRFGLLITAAPALKDFFVGEGNDVPGTKIIGDSAWHHVLVIFDGQTETTYVDSFFSASNAVALDTQVANLEIGRSAFDHPLPEPFTGAIDDLRIYDRVLSRSERGQLYLEGGWHN